MLTLKNAIKLYDELKNFIPIDIDPDREPLNFAGTIISKLKETGNHYRYINAVSIMTGYEISTLVENSDAGEVLRFFSDGIFENRLRDLKIALERFGYD